MICINSVVKILLHTNFITLGLQYCIFIWILYNIFIYFWSIHKNKYNMPLITSVRGKKPTIHQNVFIASNASIIGDVCIGSESSIWYNAVLRGDVIKLKLVKE